VDQAILKLRALTASGDFDAYWIYHLRREHEGCGSSEVTARGGFSALRVLVSGLLVSVGV
jgi:hypothetical protein